MLEKGGYMVIVAGMGGEVRQEDGYSECSGVVCWSGGGGICGVEAVKI